MTILEAAQSAGIYIPTLCYHPDLRPEGVCRICVVDVKGQRLLQPSCAYPVADGMSVTTHSPRVRAAREDDRRAAAREPPAGLPYLLAKPEVRASEARQGAWAYQKSGSGVSARCTMRISQARRSSAIRRSASSASDACGSARSFRA